MTNKIINHPGILFHDDIKKICEPLESLYNIDYFCHVHLDNKWNFTGLGKHPEFIEHYLTNQYYNFDSHLSKIDATVEYILQDAVGHHGKTAELFADCNAFGVRHVFTILYKSAKGTDAYHFASSKEDKKINEVYLRNLPLLQKFISYFKETISKDKKISAAYQQKFKINDDICAYESDFTRNANDIDLTKMMDQLNQSQRKHVFDQNNNYLTKRELECLFWLHQGKTFDLIANFLSISERTVRAHVNNIKEKLNCQTLFQLGEKVRRYNIIDL